MKKKNIIVIGILAVVAVSVAIFFLVRANHKNDINTENPPNPSVHSITDETTMFDITDTDYIQKNSTKVEETEAGGTFGINGTFFDVDGYYNYRIENNEITYNEFRTEVFSANITQEPFESHDALHAALQEQKEVMDETLNQLQNADYNIVSTKKLVKKDGEYQYEVLEKTPSAHEIFEMFFQQTEEEKAEEKIYYIIMFVKTESGQGYSISIIPMGPYVIDIAIVESHIIE